MDAPGVRLVRRLRWMGCEDHLAPIGEIAFDNVRPGAGLGLLRIGDGPDEVHLRQIFA